MYNQEKTKNRNIFFKKLMLFLIIAVSVLLILSFALPGFIWTKNLGVNYSSKDYDSIIDKFNNTSENINEENKYIEITSEEITALFNEKVNFCEIKNTQIKINSDDTFEISTSANLDCILDNVLNGVYSKNQIKSLMPKLSFLPDNVNFYIKLDGYIISNKSYLNFKTLFVQGIEVPYSIINSDEAEDIISSAVNKIITEYNRNTGSYFEKITVKDKKFNIEGKFAEF